MILTGRHILSMLLPALVVPAVLLSCTRENPAEEAASQETAANVRLALHLGGEQYTKADLDAVTEMRDAPVFRGMTDIRLIPFSRKGTIVSGDKTLWYAMNLPSIGSDGLIANNNAHLYSGLPVPFRTASVLVYGKAPKAGSGTGIESLHKDGSLLETGFTSDVPTAESVGFTPHTMLPSGSSTPRAAQDIAQALNEIVFGDTFNITAHYGDNKSMTISVPWDGNIGDDNLRDCYDNMTLEGALIPGSGANVSAMLTSLYRALAGYDIIAPWIYEVESGGTVYEATKDNGAPLLYADIYKGVRDMVLNRIRNCDALTISDADEVRFKDQTVASYPENLGLPSGAAVVRWTPSGYIVPLENGLDGIAPISSYCYPPALYYYANTTLRTSYTEEVGLQYTAENSWADILSSYTSGTVVTPNTRAVALTEPLEFAVGMLSATIKASSAMLQDNDGMDYTMVPASGTGLPLTGVVIGRQYPLNFDFTPKYVSDIDSRQYYLYDDGISGVYLGTQASPVFRTLCMQTPPGKEVYFALEFRNDTGQSFRGAEGRILPGHKFYLVGKLGFASDAAFDKVFMKDRVTTVNCVIKTLRNAHCAVPDMGIPQISLGIETEVSWIMSSPTTVMLE
jgi:hypothetical protein